MKKGVIVLVLFFLSFGNVFGDNSCNYKEYERVYDYVYNSTNVFDVVIVRASKNGYIIEQNGKQSIEFSYLDGRSDVGNSSLRFSDDGTKWGVAGRTMEGECVVLVNFEVVDTYDCKYSFTSLNEYINNNNDNEVTEEKDIPNFNIEAYKNQYKEIIVSGFAYDYSKYVFIGQKGNGDYEIRGFGLINEKWEEYKLINYDFKPIDIYYIKFYGNPKGNKITILVKENNKSMTIFNGYDDLEPVDMTIYKLLDNHRYFVYDGLCTYFFDKGDGCGENIGIGLIDMKKNGYTRYYKGTYKLYNYWNSIPIHSAYRVENKKTGKEYIVLDGVKGKEYDYVGRIKYILSTGILAYYAEYNNIRYYVEYNCN